MKNDDTASGNGNIDAARDALGRLGSQFPELAFEMLDMRLTQLLQPDILDRLQKTDEAGLKTRRERLDLGVNAVKCLDRPSQGCNIANPL